MSETQDYEWIDDEFRIERKRFGTWTSYSKDGTPLITGLTREVVLAGTKFYLEGIRTNWENCETSRKFDGTVGGKL